LKIGHVFDGKIFSILTLFFDDFIYSIALAQDFTDKYVLPRVLVYPSVWKENGVVAPMIEVKVLDQVREEPHLDVVEGNEKKSLDTKTSIDYIELPKKQGNDGDEVDVCISPIDSKRCLSC
jgi:hypothetical protein